MGGPLGLKGTDGKAREEAIRRGGLPIAPDRAMAALREAMPLEGVDILTASGPMGEDELKELGLDHRVVYEIEGMTDGNDTIESLPKVPGREGRPDSLLRGGWHGHRCHGRRWTEPFR